MKLETIQEYDNEPAGDGWIKPRLLRTRYLVGGVPVPRVVMRAIVWLGVRTGLLATASRGAASPAQPTE